MPRAGTLGSGHAPPPSPSLAYPIVPMPRQARVGLLVLVGAVLFLGAIFLVAQRTFLFSDTFFVRTQFFNVSGLIAGSNVQLQGLNVGRVEQITLPTRPGGKITVEMAIDQEAARQIRTNTRAQVQTDGLVGNQIVVLSADPNPSAALPEGGVLVGLEPFSLTAVTDQALESVERLNAITETVGLIVQDVRNGEGSLGRILYDPALYNSVTRSAGTTEALLSSLNATAGGLQAQSAEITASAQRVTEGLNATVSDFNARINSRDGTVGAFLNDRALFDRLVGTADSLALLSNNIRAITRNTEEMTAWGSLGAFRFAELMEAGKHNFLFKRYFERRGYQEEAPFAIRERAIRASQQQIEERQRYLNEWEQRLRARDGGATSAPARASATLPAPATPPDSTR